MKLTARTIAEEQVPDEHRDWVRSAIIAPFNKGAKELVAALNGQLLLGDNLAVQVFTIKVTVPDDWTALSLSSPWTSFDGGMKFPVPSYRKAPDGRVWLRGLAKTGTPQTTVAVLPAAARPALRRVLQVRGSQTSTEAAIRLDIVEDGSVFPEGGTLGTAFDFLSLELSFDAADRTPVPAACWPVAVACTLSAKPTGVVLLAAQDTASPPSFLPAVGAPDWTYSSKADTNGQASGAIKIRNVPGLAPGKKYSLTFAAFLG